MAMSLREALGIMNNEDVSEVRRRFAPAHSLTLLNRDGEIVAVVKFKRQPTEEDQIETLKKHKDCVQFSTRPGRFASLSDFEAYVAESMFLFDGVRPA